MNIILAKSAGFCFGVKRAVETVYKEADKNQTPILTQFTIQVICQLIFCYKFQYRIRH